jgi:hypothetical protein
LRRKCRLFLSADLERECFFSFGREGDRASFRTKPQEIAHVVRGAAGADNIYHLLPPGWDTVRIASPITMRNVDGWSLNERPSDQIIDLAA